MCECDSGLGSEDEVRLIETLFQKKGYNPLIRPVQNLTETVSVNFGLAMIQLINVVCNCLYVLLCISLLICLSDSLVASDGVGRVEMRRTC